MRVLRNPEIRGPFFAAVIEAGTGLFIGFLLLRLDVSANAVLWAMIPTLALCIGIFTFGAWLLFRKLRAFTLQAEESLHGKRDLRFDDFREGDLAVMKDVFQSMALSHARQAGRLEQEKGLLQESLANIMHQLKTPLQTMTQTAEALMETDVSDAERKHAARTILDTSDHISALVSTLLKLSRLDADAVTFRHDTFTVRELIDGVCEPLEMTMELREIALVKNVPEDAVICSDPLWLKEALLNIVKNCMEHTPAGGAVTVDVNDTAVATEIVIRDTGPGIDEEDLPHLFERFYRGKNAGPNSVGIGLAFTNQVVRALGGTVRAKNAPDGGAVFTVRMIKMNV